ncbi:HVA22-like protein b [Yarrowia sp. E02]|nr:HVA22-like protein b [Yarrowia sp. E02]
MFHALGSVASVVFPIFASYRAIKSGDMTYATPWLKFWVVMGIEQALENTFGVVLSVLPLYSLARLLFFAWLVLPQSQGAVRLYDEKVEPFLDRYNTQIEDFFANGHTYAKDYGLQYLSVLIKWLTGKGFDTEAAKGSTSSTVTPPPAVPLVPQSYMDSVMGYIKSNSPATGGKITRLFDMYRAAGAVGGAMGSREVTETVEIPSSLPYSEQIGLIDKERTRLLAALSSLDAQGSLLKGASTSKSNASLASGVNISASDYSPLLAASSSDTDFDVVKSEDVLGLDTNAKDEQRPNSRGWFWQRHYSKVGEGDKPASKAGYEKLVDEPSSEPSFIPAEASSTKDAEEEPLIPSTL